jgi:proteic killer suppression protein
MLRSICEDEERACATYGSDTARRLTSRLADLRAVKTVLELVAGQPKFDGDDCSELRVGLGNGYSIRCKPNHRPPPMDGDGQVDWERVHRIQIIDIEAAP